MGKKRIARVAGVQCMIPALIFMLKSSVYETS